MAKYDTEIRLHSDLDNSKLDKGAEHIEKKLDELEEKAKDTSLTPEGWSKEDWDKFEKNFDSIMERNKKKAEEAAAEMAKASTAVGEATIPQDTVGYQQYDSAAIMEQIEQQASAADKVSEKEEKIAEKIREQQVAEQQLIDIKNNAVVADQNMVALMQEQEQIIERMALLKKAGVTDGYQEYDELSARLAEINKEVHTIRLKGILLSLFIFNWISKGFNAMVSAMKEGFRNLARYSKDYNAQMSALKSSCAQFKNSLAAAFEPIVNMAIPYLVKLINWLIKAADAIAQFMAILQGKSTYTRAKKQNIDYAKSLDTTTKSAKKALAAFDELNVLSEQGGTTAGGGELTGKDAFEEASVNPKMVEMLEKAKKLLKIIKPLAVVIGITLLAWRIAGLLKDFRGLVPYLSTAFGLIMLIAGVALMVYNYMKMWENGVDWEGIVGYVAGLALAVVGLLILFGPIAAGIGLIVGGTAGLILALKDITENGLNAKNMTLLLISAGAILAGVFITLGGAATVVVGAVMAVIAAIAGVVVWAGNGEEALSTLKDELNLLGKFVKSVFVGDWKGAFDAIIVYAKKATNLGNIIAESFLKLWLNGLNTLIDAINSFKIDIPDWVPKWGGQTWSPNLKNIPTDLPRLADGAVIQGGKPFAAILGDQPRGQTNIETPLATMMEAFKQAQAENGGGTYTFVAKLNEREIFRETVRQDRMYKNTHGQSAFI